MRLLSFEAQGFENLVSPANGDAGGELSMCETIEPGVLERVPRRLGDPRGSP